MDKKIIITAIVAVALVIVVAGVYAVTNSHESKDVTYNGNGGTYEGESTFVSSNETVLPIMFINTGHSFAEWNTKADGSGETYAVGEESTYGIVLYAQWVHSVTTYSTSIVGNFTPIFYIDGQTGFVGYNLGSSAVITVSGGSGWTYDSASESFSCTYEGEEYVMQVEIIGALNIVSTVVDDVPTTTFDTPVDIEISFIIHPTF